MIGFLIAVALLVPLYLGFAVAALSMGPVGQFVSTLSFPLPFFLGQFPIYRARRYRLTRTVYRGVRCHQRGSALHYAVCAAFWWSTIVLTIGLAFPFAQSRLERFKMRHTFYGDLQGRFEGSGLRLVFPRPADVARGDRAARRPVTYSAAPVEWDKVIAAAAQANSGAEFFNQLETALPAVYVAAVVSAGAVTVSVLMAAVLFPVFQAMLLRWWISGLRLGTLTIRSQLRTKHIYGAYLRFLWYGLLFSIAATVACGAAFFALNAVLDAFARSEVTEAFNVLAGLAFYVVIMLGYSTIYQGTVKLALWRSGMESIELEGADALDRVRAEGAPPLRGGRRPGGRPQRRRVLDADRRGPLFRRHDEHVLYRHSRGGTRGLAHPQLRRRGDRRMALRRVAGAARAGSRDAAPPRRRAGAGAVRNPRPRADRPRSTPAPTASTAPAGPNGACASG